MPPIRPLWLARQVRLVALDKLARAARARAGRTGSPDDLARAVTLTRQAVEWTRPGDPVRPVLLNTLAGTLCLAYGLTGDADALAEAITASREAVDDPESAPFRGICLCTLTAALRLELERTRDPGRLAGAEAVAREAVAATGEGHREHGGALLALANVLLTRHQITGEVPVAREAARWAEAAAGEVPAGAHRAVALNSLANARLLVHRATTDDDILEQAGEAARHSVEETPPGDPGRAAHVNTLAAVLLTRYGRTGRTTDLREALRVSRTAADTVSPGHVLRPAVLHTLAGVLLELYGRTGQESALDEAIETARRAMDQAGGQAAGGPVTPGLHNTLSMAGMMRYLDTGDEKALAQARAEASRACAAGGDGHPQRAVFLSNLAKALRAAYEREPAPDLLDELVATGRLVAAASTGTALHRADHLIELTLALLHRYEHLGDPDVLREARDHATEAAGSPYALPWQQVTAHRLLGRAQLALGEREAALDAYRTAVGLLPKVAPRRLERMDREQGLSRIAGLGPEAASAALAAEAPELALELLEQARGVLIGERLGTRSETARLAAADSALAGELDRVRVLLDLPQEQPGGPGGPARAGSGGAPSAGLPVAATAGLREAERARGRREELEAEWDSLMARIRGLEGFEDFLGRPSTALLSREAATGPVVLVNASVHGCDALILTGDAERPVRVVPLDGVAEPAVAEQVTRLRDALEDRRDIDDVLGWAWDRVTEPVLSALGHTGPRPLDRRPRLWWVATGSFAFLPLHAAGHHGLEEARRGAGRTVMDRVVSSYTPTVRALGHARRATPATPGPGPRSVLIVAMPETPGEAPLRGVGREVADIAGAVPDTEILAGERATHEAVRGAVPRHTSAHFACHGVGEPRNPATSRLLLDDHLAAPFDVAAVSGLDLARAELAYLSACSTTESSVRSADESVHITAAFLLAGFAGVVGTLWPVQDSAARRIAVAFYEEMYAREAGDSPVDRAAYALQHAVDRLRAKRPDLPALWSAHIHMGV
ncbi:CHAT domain-containing protein [Streptomyces bacillaris]|uniref:CHAT domain-containing protein n=1 Tax=Streptomyces bacillaris TaxID=68179 RepID=UPI0035D72A66